MAKRGIGLGLILGGLILLPAAAQKDKPPLPPLDEDGNYYVQGVVEVDSVAAGDLFDRATVWVALAYRSANDVVQHSDKASGRIIVKGIFEISYHGTPWSILHTLTVEIKDGRYRYTFTGFESTDGRERWPIEVSTKKVAREVGLEANRMGEDLKAHMLGQSTMPGDDDW